MFNKFGTKVIHLSFTLIDHLFGNNARSNGLYVDALYCGCRRERPGGTEYQIWR